LVRSTFDKLVGEGDIVLVPEVSYKLLDGPEVWGRGGDVVTVDSSSKDHRGIFTPKELKAAIASSREQIVSSFLEKHADLGFKATDYAALKEEVEAHNSANPNEAITLPDIKAIRIEGIVNPTGEMWQKEQIREVARTLMAENKASGSNITLMIDDVYNGTQLRPEMSQGASVLTEPEFQDLSYVYLSGLHKRMSPQAHVCYVAIQRD